MMKPSVFLAFFVLFISCKEDEPLATLLLTEASVGDKTLSPQETNENIAIDRTISLTFSLAIQRESIDPAISLTNKDGIPVNFNTNLIDNKTISISPIGVLETSSNYLLSISSDLKASNGVNFSGTTIEFTTILGSLEITSGQLSDGDTTRTGRIQNIPVNFNMELTFNKPLAPSSLQTALSLTGPGNPILQFELMENDQKLVFSTIAPLQHLAQYSLKINNQLKGANGENFTGTSSSFYTQIDETPKFPLLSDQDLLTKIQAQTFRYFWDFAHPNSGLARERNTSGNTVTIGGSGFGIMALIVGVERGFITRQEAIERWNKIIDFLASADRFHGVWPHWMHGKTGKTIPFSTKDNGGDLVETAFMIQGLLTVRAYLNANNADEKILIDKITQLWETVEWDWYTKNNSDVLYWHWSPNYEWEMNLPIRGYNESLIVYVLAASSPTHPIDKAVYETGWARNGDIKNGNSFYSYELPLGNDLGGPLFFAHYSFLGLDPRNLSDQYANYWEQNQAHSHINQAYCIQNPKGFVGYTEATWGLTASDNHNGYNAHSPSNDLGVITPTAALSSFPYTPDESMAALKYFYYQLGDKIWGEYGFYDAYNITENWYADSYLAIDQGPIILMIENYRTGLLWDLFMNNAEIQSGLDKLEFTY
ncbi:glucoamylase family protein [Echinicola salinicaeni]|uniref:glucoamylase family protein n=1 Tax=Echinicola salinicaeni TaxID=2762757 RepID=UPI00293BA4D8|nr:glucoamylase family protein [Echinicola salinicaeni]